MEEEIKEFYENDFQQCEEMLEGSCHNIQEKFQHAIVSPFIVNEENQDLSGQISIPSSQIDVMIQQYLEISTYQEKDMDSQSVCFAVHLSSNEVIEEEAFVVLDHFENEDDVQNFELIDSEIMKNHNDILVESHARSLFDIPINMHE